MTSHTLLATFTTQCDTYGVTSYWFSCSKCYQGLATITYVNPDHPDVYHPVHATVKSGDHPGKCKASTKYSCAAEFVANYPVDERVSCWFDPKKPTKVIFSRGYTAWIWMLMYFFLAIALITGEATFGCLRAIITLCTPTDRNSYRRVPDNIII